MNKTTKIIIWIAVAIVVVGGIWWWMSSRNEASEYGSSSASSTAAAAAPAATTTAPAPTGDSDQAINQDMTNINAQMNGFASDSASIDQGLNDQAGSGGQDDQF